MARKKSSPPLRTPRTGKKRETNVAKTTPVVPAQALPSPAKPGKRGRYDPRATKKLFTMKGPPAEWYAGVRRSWYPGRDKHREAMKGAAADLVKFLRECDGRYVPAAWARHITKLLASSITRGVARGDVTFVLWRFPSGMTIQLVSLEDCLKLGRGY